MSNKLASNLGEVLVAGIKGNNGSLVLSGQENGNNEPDDVEIISNLALDDNDITDVGKITFSDGSEMDTALHLETIETTVGSGSSSYKAMDIHPSTTVSQVYYGFDADNCLNINYRQQYIGLYYSGDNFIQIDYSNDQIVMDIGGYNIFCADRDGLTFLEDWKIVNSDGDYCPNIQGDSGNGYIILSTDTAADATSYKFDSNSIYKKTGNGNYVDLIPHLYEVKGTFYVYTTDNKETRFNFTALTTDSRSIEDFNDLTTWSNFIAFMNTLHNINCFNDTGDNQVDGQYEVFDIGFGSISSQAVWVNYTKMSANYDEVLQDAFVINQNNFDTWDGDNLPGKHKIF